MIEMVDKSTSRGDSTLRINRGECRAVGRLSPTAVMSSMVGIDIVVVVTSKKRSAFKKEKEEKRR